MSKNSNKLLKLWQYTATHPILQFLFTLLISLLLGVAAFIWKNSPSIDSSNSDSTLAYLPYIAGLAGVVFSSGLLNRAILDKQTVSKCASCFDGRENMPLLFDLEIENKC